ncbi:DoxX family protein [Streptomyces sp. SP18CS02]|uniref:DoxX family protein n=1 Tax=Streptomyces sp. SP18CS02 TaxID=3002531 RepID=UPI002E764D69|nr:DoxX family protein [Streptomyces sp. SP18CS02]MEE1754608.1 DoxX family protein [Streptomyces sp. SP18CS02]
MAILRKLARPLLASVFVTGGFQVLRHPRAVAPAAAPVALPVASRIPLLPEDPEQLARISGAVQTGAGVLLTLGRLPRLSAFALAATLVPTTLAGHRYWTVEDPQERARQRVHFYKNLSLLGGLLIAVADTHGKPSLARRSRRAVADGRRSARSARRAVDAAAARSAGRARAAAHTVATRLPTG